MVKKAKKKKHAGGRPKGSKDLKPRGPGKYTPAFIEAEAKALLAWFKEFKNDFAAIKEGRCPLSAVLQTEFLLVIWVACVPSHMQSKIPAKFEITYPTPRNTRSDRVYLSRVPDSPGKHSFLAPHKK